MGLKLDTVKQAQQPAGRKRGASFSLDRLYQLGSREIRLFKTIGQKQKERFYTDISMLLSAGVDLQTVLELTLQGTPPKNRLHNIYHQILERIITGEGLAEAMEATGVFNNFDCFSIRIGENTGALPDVLTKLSGYYARRVVQQRKLSAALSYPIVVLATTVGAMFFMLKFVVPMFSETLVRFGGTLPALTRFIIALSGRISLYFSVLLLVGTVIGFLYYRNRHKDSVRRFISTLVLHTPYVGRIVHKTHMARFAQAMDLLLHAKVSIVESIDLTQQMIRFYPLSQALKAVNRDIRQGAFFYEAMQQQTIFEPSMITMIKIGEEVNQLDRIFAQLSKQYEGELEYHSGILVSVLEPVMILILALMVSVILVAMYLPMFRIGTVIH